MKRQEKRQDAVQTIDSLGGSDDLFSLMRCATCFYFDSMGKTQEDIEYGGGSCHRCPPNESGKQASTTSGNWCGEHANRSFMLSALKHYKTTQERTAVE